MPRKKITECYKIANTCVNCGKDVHDNNSTKIAIVEQIADITSRSYHRWCHDCCNTKRIGDNDFAVIKKTCYRVKTGEYYKIKTRIEFGNLVYEHYNAILKEVKFAKRSTQKRVLV